jgi:hypothetical protein
MPFQRWNLAFSSTLILINISIMVVVVLTPVLQRHNSITSKKIKLSYIKPWNGCLWLLCCWIFLATNDWLCCEKWADYKLILFKMVLVILISYWYACILPTTVTYLMPYSHKINISQCIITETGHRLLKFAWVTLHLYFFLPKVIYCMFALEWSYASGLH